MRNGFNVVLISLTIAYPFLWFFWSGSGGFRWIAVLMAVVWGLRALLQKQAMPRVIALVLAGFFILILWLHNSAAMYWYPVWVNLLMLIVFGSSLFGKRSIIEQFARIKQPDLPLKGIKYTRRVTQIWCVFFVLNGLITLLLIESQLWTWWTIYTGIISYVLMGVLLGGEFVYRRYFLKI